MYKCAGASVLFKKNEQKQHNNVNKVFVIWMIGWLRLDRSTARYFYRAEENLLIIVLTCVQETKYFFNWLKQMLF
jgi:hypothetical protein